MSHVNLPEYLQLNQPATSRCRGSGSGSGGGGDCAPSLPSSQFRINHCLILGALFAPAILACMRWNAQRAAAPVSWIVLCSIGVNTGKSPTLGNISPDADLVDGSAIRGRFARFEVASCILGQFCEGAWSRVGGGGSAGAQAALVALAGGGGAVEGVVGLFRSGLFRVSNCAFMQST